MRVHCFEDFPHGSYIRSCNCYSFGTVSVQGACCYYRYGNLIPPKAPAASVSYGQSPAVSASPASVGVHALTNGFSNLQIAPSTYTQPTYAQNQAYVQNAGYSTAYPQAAWYPQQQQATSAPIYVRDPHGLSVNVSQGAIRTEQRNLHISNLDYKMGKAELDKILSKEAKPVQIDLPMDSSTRKNKGTALAYFAKPEDAKRVLDRYNGYPVKGKKLRIKFDKNTTSVETATAPTIINGSTGYSGQNAVYPNQTAAFQVRRDWSPRSPLTSSAKNEA
jgi:RNA recognition motif. (a.k.a. RRM, RBD, or RNP domain)